MSANHDIKSQPPAAHFTTILCTKSQQSRFVALPRQLPHLKKFKSLTERGKKGEEPATLYLISDFVVYCYDRNSPVLWIGKFLFGGTFYPWLASWEGDGRGGAASEIPSWGGHHHPPTPPGQWATNPFATCCPPPFPPQASSRSPCPCAPVVWSCPALGWISIIKNSTNCSSARTLSWTWYLTKGYRAQLLRQVTPKPRFPHPPDLSGGERRHVCNLWKSPSDYRWIIVRSKTMIEAQ